MTAGPEPSEIEVSFSAVTLEKLLKISQSLLTIQEPTALLEQIAEDAHAALGADVVVLYVYEEEANDVMVPPVVAGTLLTGEVLRTTSKERPHRESAVFKMLHRREPFYAENAREDWPRSLDGWSWEGSFLQREGIASSAAIPLTANEKTAGVLFINYRKPRTFGESARRVIELFASSAANAIRNARLLHDERTLRQEAETLRQVAGTIGSAQELDDVKNQILNGLARIVEYDTASLQIIRGDHRILLAGRGFAVDTATRHLTRPISRDPLIQRIVQSQEPLILSHPELDSDWGRHPYTADVKSWIGIPLIYDREVIGLLTADHRQPGFYQEEIRDALVAFAEEVAVAVRNARIFDSAQRRIRDLAIINDVTELMATKLDPEDLLKTLVSQVAQRLECTHCTIFFPRDQDGETYLVPQETYGERSAVIRTRQFRSDEGLAGWVYQHGESLVLGDAKKDERFAAAREEQDRPRSMLVVPVKVGDRTIGVISADQDEYGWFGESERRLLDALAKQAGIAIERATGLDLLQDIGHRILSAPKEHEILYEVVQGALKLTHTSSAVIYLIGEDGMSVTRSYQYPDDFDHPPPRMDNEKGITRQVIRERRHRTFRDIGVDERVNPVLRDRLIRSMIALPMISGDTVIGVLYLNDVQAHQFTDTEISLLTTLAGQASIAIENVRLLEARDRQAEELKLLHEVSAGLLTPNLDELLSFIIQGAMRLTQTESGFIYLLSNDGRKITKSVAYPPDAPYPHSAPSDGGLTRYIFDHREPVFVDDTGRDPRVNPAIREQQIKSLVGQPLKIAEQVIGILYLNDTSYRKFSESERSLIATLAEQAAVAIYNARLFTDSERLSRGYQTLSSVGTTLMGMLEEEDEKEILEHIARSAAETLDCTHCTVFRVQEDELVVETSQGDREWSLPEGRRFRRGQGLAGWVGEARESLLVLDARADPRFDPGWSAPQPDPESLVLAPIVVGGQVYGVVSVEQNRTHAFLPSDLRLLETLASQAGQALQNAQLFATRQRLETQLESLHQVVQEQNLETVLERIVMGISAILGEGISPTINLYNEETGMFTRCHACGPWKEALQVPPRPEGTGRYVIGTGQPLYLPDVHDPPPGAPAVRKGWIKKGIHSFAAIPLKREEHIVGVLYVNAQRPLSFSPEIRRVLELFAGQAAIAIHISQDLERKIRELEVLTEIGRTVSNLGIDQILDLVYTETSKIVDLGDAQVQIALYDRDKDEVTFPLAVEQNDGELIDIVRDGIREKFLFRAEVEFQNELAQGVLPEPLRQELAEQGSTLGDNLTVETKVENRTWLIHDQDRTYVVRKGKGLYARKDQALLGQYEKLILYEIGGEAVKQFQPRPRGSRFGLTEYVLDIKRPALLRDEFRQERTTGQDSHGDSFVLDLPMNGDMEEAQMVGVRVWRRFGKLDRPTNSWLGVPMIVQDNALGIISIQSLGKEEPVDRGQLKVLEVVANQAAVAIENARLLEKEKEHAEKERQYSQQLEGLRQIGSRIASTFDLQEALHEIANIANQILEADFTTIFPYTAEQGFGHGARAGVISRPPSIPSRTGFCAWLVREEHIVEVENAASYPGVNREFLTDCQVESFLGIPAKFDTRPVGVIIANYQRRQSFTENQKRLAEQIASLSAVAIENATRAELIADRERYMTMVGLAADLVHRINNRAGTIPLRAQQLEERLNPADPQYWMQLRDVQGIMRDARALLQESQELEQLEEAERAPEPTLVDIGERLESISSKIQVECQANIEVIEVIAADLPHVLAIAEELDHALWSVAQNGVEAMSEQGGKLIIQARTVDYEQQAWIEIKVADEGPGIPVEIRERLFEPFYSTRRGRSRGFGLWRARQVFRKLGGTIGLAESDRPGTVFVIRLPLVGGTVGRQE